MRLKVSGLRSSLALAVLVAACAGCGAAGASAAGNPFAMAALHRTGAGRPPLAIVVREGDARGALGLAVTTEGIAPDRGAVVGVALAALVQERLAARGIEATATGGWSGWRLHTLAGSPAEATRAVEAIRTALLTPVAPDEPGVPAAGRAIALLAHRPLPDRALIDVARCTGEAYGGGADTAPAAGELESWRAAAHGLGRVAMATAGDAWLGDAAALALGRATTWPTATPPASSVWPAADAPAATYDASGDVSPGGARAIVTARTSGPERAVAAAQALGDPRGPLASRLAALEAPARIRSVAATAHGDGGCLAVTFDWAARDLGGDVAAHIATAVALTRQEVAVEIADVEVPADLVRSLVARAPDPREAAERAAWWTLAGRRAGVAKDEVRISTAVGLAPSRDASEPSTKADAIRAEIDRAAIAWRAPVVEARTRVERGQGEAWILLASPCGALPETSNDAGTGAVVATAAALQASQGAADAQVEPLVAADGIGVLVHGPAHDGESPQAHARRLADLVARAFGAEPLDPGRMTQARARLLARAAQPEARARGALAGAMAPGHPSWFEPAGTGAGLAAASFEAIAMRSAAIRAGPLRVAVLANADAAQADAAVRAVDRWIARRPGELRTCPSVPSPAPPRPGTYAVDLSMGAPTQALLALPLPAGDEASRSAGFVVAAALDGPDGLLAHALGAGNSAGAAAVMPLANAWGASVLGDRLSAALVVRLATRDPSLDAGVAQVRALLDRLRQGALREEDRARAATSMSQAGLASSLDPHSRVLSLWRGEGSPLSAPPLDALRSFAATTLHDDALVIVSARPGRSVGARR